MHARIGASLLSASALLLAGCGKEEAPANQAAAVAPEPADSDTVVFASGTRDRLCLQRSTGAAALITFAPTRDANCTVRGRFDAEKGVIVPDGDERCRIPAAQQGSALTLGDGGPACAYYCGPSASFAGVTLNATTGAPPPTDLAGDPLC
jgi:hypothetical protein